MIIHYRYYEAGLKGSLYMAFSTLSSSLHDLSTHTSLPEAKNHHLLVLSLAMINFPPCKSKDATLNNT